MTRALPIALTLWAAVAHAQDLGPAVDAAPAIAAPDPDAPTAGASVDRAEAYVGDRITVTVTSIARGGVAVSLPQKLELGSLELLERDDAEGKGRDLGDGRRSFRWILSVAAYEVGPAELPPLQLNYLDPRGDIRTISTAPVSLSIRGLIDESNAAPEPQPARSPRSALIEDHRVIRAAWAAACLVALFLIVLLVRRIARSLRRERQAVEGPVVPARPPGEVAIERLTAIRARGDFARDGYRPFAFETAEVVRAYLGARYGFDALELTSTELLAELTRAAPHLVEPGSEVLRFLDQTDLIKFAKTGSSEAEALALLDAAQAIVLSTAPKLEVAAEMLSGPVRPPHASASARGSEGEGG